MAEYKQVDLQIGTETQFEEKKSSLPVGTLVGITDPIHKSELDSDLQTTISDVANKLNKPSGTPTADSVVKVSSTGTPTYKPVSDFFDITVPQRVTAPQYFEDIAVTNAYIDKVRSSSNDNQFKFKDPNTYGVAYGIALTPDNAPTEPSFIVTAADRTPTWQSAAPILQDYVDDALLGG